MSYQNKLGMQGLTSELNWRSIFQQKNGKNLFFAKEKNPQDTISLTQTTLKGYFSSFRLLIIFQTFFTRLTKYFLELNRLKTLIRFRLQCKT